MNEPQDLYEGLPQEVSVALREEAIEKYGLTAIEVSEDHLLTLGKRGFSELQNDLHQVFRALSNVTHESPGSEAVQQLIDRHYRIIRQLWGTAKMTNPQAIDYEGLGQLYADDPRYTMVDGQPKAELAQLMSQAMSHYARTVLK
ncbi:MAG: TipAS antibiotic-recognition domain-containing protein [Bacteroidota bacterium]